MEGVEQPSGAAKAKPKSKKSKVGIALLIFGIILLIIGLLFTVAYRPKEADYTDEEISKNDDIIQSKEPGDEITVLFENIDRLEVIGLNNRFPNSTFHVGDDVIITYEVKYEPIINENIVERKSVEILGGFRFYLGIILVVIGVIIMLVGAIIKNEAKKKAHPAPQLTPETPATQQPQSPVASFEDQYQNLYGKQPPQ